MELTAMVGFGAVLAAVLYVLAGMLFNGPQRAA